MISPLSAQEVVFQQEQYPFPVTFYGVEPQLGFTSASSYYHHDFGDLDGDGDCEIILGAASQREYLLENVGTVFSAAYSLITSQIVVPTSDWTLQAPVFCDIDNDSDLDLFITSIYGEIAFYENTGDSLNYDFVLVDSTFGEINTENGISPDFVDIDCDGDYDLFLGNYYGSPQAGRIYFYNNIGTPDSANMTYITDFFDSIDVHKIKKSH